MKLRIVPARAGFDWMRRGVRTFWRQPLALSGLFLLFMGLMSLLTLLPVLGAVLALTLLPAATLGLMAATQESEAGRFPMPWILLTGLRANRQGARGMASLGLMYALGFLGIMAASALCDGGDFARFYLLGQAISEEAAQSSGFVGAMWLSLALYLPLSMMFWHAPALVHWHGVQPIKSLFFSLVACWRNWRAQLVYALSWLLLSVLSLMGLVSVVHLFLDGSGQVLAQVSVPLMLMLMAMFFCSIFFSYQDSFVWTEPGQDGTPDAD